MESRTMKRASYLMKKPLTARLLSVMGVRGVALLFMVLVSQTLWVTPAQAVCAVHDHNCFHSSEPFNPSLDDLQTGTGDLTITSTWTGEADVNLHTGLPDDVDINGNPIYGPFVASNPDGNPVTGSPLGTDPNILFHGQQTVQWANASALANLTSDTQPASPGGGLNREEEAIISGNVPSGLYDFALHSYNDRNVPDAAVVDTLAKAGQDGYFLDDAVLSAARLASGHNPVLDSTGATIELDYTHNLNPTDVSAIETFNYQYRNFDEHANGVYVIPDGVWNMHGVDPQQLYQFASADRSDGFILNQGYQFEANPFDLEKVDMNGYPGAFYDANSGVYFQLGYDDGTEDGQGGNRLSRVSVNPREFNTVQTALYMPINIMQQEGINSISSDERGVVGGYRDQSYDRARAMIGCPSCTDERLVSIDNEIGSGSNTYGLTPEEQTEFHRHVISGYSAAGYYRSLKNQYRRGQRGKYVGMAITAVLNYFGIPVSVSLGYQSDVDVGVGDIIVPGDCALPPCNGRTQNDLAMNLGVSRFGGTDILRVDSTNGTVQVNDGRVIERDIFDLGGDGAEEAVKTMETIDGGGIFGIGYGYGGTSVGVSHGPNGLSVSGSVGIDGTLSVGATCGSGGCSGQLGLGGDVGIGGGFKVSGALVLDTDSGLGGNVGLGFEGQNGFGSTVTVNQDGDLGVGFTPRHTDSDGRPIENPITGLFAGNSGSDPEGNNSSSNPETAFQPDNGANPNDGQNSGESGTNNARPPDKPIEEIVVTGSRLPPKHNNVLPVIPPHAASNRDAQNNGGGCTTGKPCNPSTGSKFQQETDINSGRLSLVRSYNSQGQVNLGFGNGWSSNLLRELEYIPEDDVLLVVQADGKKDPWKRTPAGWEGEADSKLELTETKNGYKVVYQSGLVEFYNQHYKLIESMTSAGQTTRYDYDEQGRLTRKTEPYGLALTVAYNSDNLIASITTPNNDEYRYTYDALGNLVSVIYPDNTPFFAQDNPRRQYHYENAEFPTSLTGISDENGNRWSVATYSAEGKVATSGLVVTTNRTAQERSRFVYGEDTTVVIDANGHKETWQFERILGENKLVAKLDAQGKGARYAYDGNGNRTLGTDAEGRQTQYVYNDHNQLTRKIENPQGPQRITEYRYRNADSTLVTHISQPSVADKLTQTTHVDYTPTAQVSRITVNGYRPDGTAVSRQHAFSYNKAGQLIAIDGARDDVRDVTKLSYYTCQQGPACGQLKSITNALGHQTHFLNYDEMGRVTQTKDANGVITHVDYHPRGWVTRQTHTLSQGKQRDEARVTRYHYDYVGQLLKTTFADGVTLTFAYDHAHALRRVTDSLGNQVEYDYDAKGNRTHTTLTNAQGEVESQVTTQYDLRDRVKAVEQGQSLTQLLTDATGQITALTDPNNNPATEFNYDAFNRLSESVDALSQSTRYTYNVADQVIAVRSANGATTRYEYDDLGNQLLEVSPDRGIIEYQHDAAGNVVQSRDARNVVTHYDYDALNRLVLIRYPNKQENAVYRYDRAPHCRIGALCSAKKGTVATHYAYDAWGNIRAHTETVDEHPLRTQYTYDAVGRVKTLTLPNNQHAVTYARDALGRVTGVSANQQPLVSERTYRADGQFTAQTWGNGVIEHRQYDNQSRLTRQQFAGDHGPEDVIYQYDANGNVLNRANHQYQYDALNRVVSDTNYSYQYDANSNRLATQTAQHDQSLGYYSNSNQLFSMNEHHIQHDAAGNQLRDQAGRDYHYNQAGRLRKVTKGKQTIATYRYNAFNQRVSKTVNGVMTRFSYDLQGQLIQERTEDEITDQTTTYVWLDGQPIAQLTVANDPTYLISDHLNTPRIGLNQAQQPVWQWQSDAFGHNAPTSTKGVTINLRFPGQYADHETGLYYNWHRYYDPQTGRYITSDPIGLIAGVNTYGYVGGNPVNSYDFMGLADIFCGIDLTIPLLPFPFAQVDFAGGIVIDTDEFLDSGFFTSTGTQVGLNVSIGVIFGVSDGDIEGMSTEVDVGGQGLIGGQVTEGDDGSTSTAVTIGPGLGISGGRTNTTTHTIRGPVESAIDVVNTVGTLDFWRRLAGISNDSNGI